jgi:DeoR/GlpR family transcriptional regulator of sugar metabolism
MFAPIAYSFIIYNNIGNSIIETVSMRIFLSHSSRIKPLIRELRAYLPEHINAWIDEKDLLAGESLEHRIRSAIESDCDFLVAFLDDSVIRSQWVTQELDWARAEEERLRRPFILPVLIDDVDLGELGWLSKRIYLRCHGFAESDIRRLANELSSALFAWLSRDIDRLRKPARPESDDLAVIERADRLLQAAAHQVRVIVLPYRKENPLRLRALYEQLVTDHQTTLSSPDELNDLLFRLRERKLLSGITITAGKIYVEEEHLSWRLQESIVAKQAIAEFVADNIESGNVVFVDAGSTTLLAAKAIIRNMRFRVWDSLTIVTSSPPVAAEFASIANELGLDDYDARLQLYMVGGRMRMNAATVVPILGRESSIPGFSDHLGGFDIALCGTNGIHWPGGCTTTAESQAEGKRLALDNSRRRMILADASKYNVRQQQIFASFDINLEIVTAPDSNRAIVAEFSELLADTTSKIVMTGES